MIPPDTAKRLAKVYERLTAGEGADRLAYENLSRAEQNVLIRLFGGGTLRNADETALNQLASHGLVRDAKLTPLGEEICREALPGVRERIGERFI